MHYSYIIYQIDISSTNNNKSIFISCQTEHSHHTLFLFLDFYHNFMTTLSITILST